MTSMMKAAVKLKPAPKSTEVRNVPIPEPTPSEVLIRMDIASICGTDVHIYDWDAWAAARIKVPLVQGHEFAGHIEKLGSGVTGLRKGDYVSAEGHIACGRCYMCRTGNAHVCKNVSILGIDRAGSFAQYMTVPASNVIVNDDDLPLDLATMQDPLGNAVYAVTNAKVTGTTIASFGLGPIGLMAVALCRGMAARTVIAIGHRNQYRMDLAKTVGASLVLRSGESLVDEVMDATAGEGVDEVLEFSGSEAAVQQAIRVVRPAGGIHLLGLFPKPLSLDISEFVTKGLSMYGIHGRLMYKMWMQMGGLLKSGNVDLKAGRTGGRQDPRRRERERPADRGQHGPPRGTRAADRPLQASGGGLVLHERLRGERGTHPSARGRRGRDPDGRAEPREHHRRRPPDEGATRDLSTLRRRGSRAGPQRSRRLGEEDPRHHRWRVLDGRRHRAGRGHRAGLRRIRRHDLRRRRARRGRSRRWWPRRRVPLPGRGQDPDRARDVLEGPGRRRRIHRGVERPEELLPQQVADVALERFASAGRCRSLHRGDRRPRDGAPPREEALVQHEVLQETPRLDGVRHRTEPDADHAGDARRFSDRETVQ